MGKRHPCQFHCQGCLLSGVTGWNQCECLRLLLKRVGGVLIVSSLSQWLERVRPYWWPWLPSGWGWLGTYWLRPPVRLERVGYVLNMSSCPVGTGLEFIDYVFLSGWTGLGTYWSCAPACGGTGRVRIKHVFLSGWSGLGTYWSCVPVRLEVSGYILIMSSCPVGAGWVRTDHVFLSGWSG